LEQEKARLTGLPDWGKRAALRFVIPTGAKRSGGICCFFPRILWLYWTAPFGAQVEPKGVCLFNERDLLRTIPSLQLFLACDCCENVRVRFEKYEAMASIARGKAVFRMTMFRKPRFGSTCNADIECARTAGKDADVVEVLRSHSLKLGRDAGKEK
jgi:hypothetical protein